MTEQEFRNEMIKITDKTVSAVKWAHEPMDPEACIRSVCRTQIMEDFRKVLADFVTGYKP